MLLIELYILTPDITKNKRCNSWTVFRPPGIMPAQEKERHLVVRQSYAFKMSGGTQECEAARAKAMLEVSRVITADGTVVKTMLDGTTEVRTRRRRGSSTFTDTTLHRTPLHEEDLYFYHRVVAVIEISLILHAVLITWVVSVYQLHWLFHQ